MKYVYKFIASLLFLTALHTAVFAQFEEGIKIEESDRLIGSEIVTGGTLTKEWSADVEVPKKIKHIITFSIDEQSTTYFASGFTAIVHFTVDSWENLSGPMVTDNTSLQITFDKAEGSKYTALAYLTFDDLAKVRITVTDEVNITGATGWAPLSVLKLENKIEVVRYYTLANTTNLLTPSLIDGVDNTDALEVSWGWHTETNNNLSQLEWAWVGDDMEDYYKENDVINFNKLFQNNSTRVDIDYVQNNYQIPLLYDGAGKLYYRVRAATKKNDGNIIAGPWSQVETFPFPGHEGDLNWQSSTVFAENGRRKSVIQYFDGSLRNRQTVTKDNSSGNTIVSETIYDLQGRPNLQILPTPIFENTIKYNKNFNRFVGQLSEQDNPVRYFDLTPTAVQCQASPPLNTAYGNGKYYSPNNPWLNDINEPESKFIPDAEGYAYTETRFTDDATERIKSQSGIGIKHRIDSGHETKYFYGKPTQDELDALFGTEVGYASHYSKNMVQDANGQMSVSYVDMHNRTIATALAGEHPGNLDPIYTNTSDYPSASNLLRNDLLTPENNLVNGNSIVSVSTILAPVPTEYNFTYKLDPEILQQLNCFEEKEICFDCKYDLEISIRSEECQSDPPIIRKYNNLQVVPANQACGTSMGFIGDGVNNATKQIEFSDSLATGSWVVRKTLTINDSLFSIRRDSALKEFLCRSQQDIYDSVYNVLLSTSDCDNPDLNLATCDSCLIHLGSLEDYTLNYFLSVGEQSNINAEQIYQQYKKDSLECSDACGISSKLSTLASIRTQLLTDMIPFTGQYAIKNDFDPARFEARYNIFSESFFYNGETIVGDGQPYFRNPWSEDNEPSFYYTEENKIDQTIHSESNLPNITPKDYSNQFQRSWTNSLIYRHPEFSKLKFAETELKDAYKWLDDVERCDKYEDAINLGFTNPLLSDPYFTNNYVPDDNVIMDRYINDYIGKQHESNSLSIWRISNGSVLCAEKPDYLKQACYDLYSQNGMDEGATEIQRDKIWQKFKTVYLSFRNEMVLKYINSQPGVLSQISMNILQNNEGKQLRFVSAPQIAEYNNWDWYSAVLNSEITEDTTGLAAAANNSSESFITDKCVSQRSFWKARLMQCEQLLSLIEDEETETVDNIINSILDGLETVCHNSINLQHPYGASTVIPSYTGTPRSFEEVVNEVFAQYEIAPLPDNNYFCNPFSLDFPKPFGKNPPLMTNYSNSLDTCACKRYEEVNYEAHQLGLDTLDFTVMNQFLLENYHDTLPLLVWDGLKRCGNFYQDTCQSHNTLGRPLNSDSLCPKPVIVDIQANSNTDIITIQYLPRPDYENCALLAYDSAFNQIINQPINCEDSVVILDSLNPYRTYFFQIAAMSECGKVFSDIKSYNTLNCSKPLITSIKYESDIMVIYHTPQVGLTQCTLLGYDEDNNQVVNEEIECEDTEVNISGLNYCQKYAFQIVSNSEICGTITSDSVYYNGYDTCCKKPVITSVNYDTSGISFTYIPNSNSGQCNIIVYDENNTQILTQEINCWDSSGIVSGLNECEKYNFRIVSYSEICDSLFSDIIHYDGCCPKPVIKGLVFSTETGFYLNYAPHANYNQCSLIGYDAYNNQIVNKELNCGDSSVEVSEVNFGEDYYFLIVSVSDSCGVVISDTTHYNSFTSCGSKPLITSIVYNPINKLFEIKYKSFNPNSFNFLVGFDENNNQITRILNSADSVVQLSGLYSCKNYSFILMTVSDTCFINVSDTALYTPTDSCCNPKITKLQYRDSDSTIEVSYLPQAGNDGCSIRVYDENNIEIINQATDCSESYLLLSGLDPEGKYRFQMVSYSAQCDSLYSDTTYYHGSCPKPVITNIKYTGSFTFQNETIEVIEVRYTPYLNYDYSNLILYDENNIENYLGINTYDSFFYAVVPSRCKNYGFQIESYSATCGNVLSDTVYLPASDSCCSKPVISSVTYNYISNTMDVQYNTKSENEACIIRVYDENNIEVINQELDCAASSISLNEFSPCKKYRFEIVSYSTVCDSIFSDTTYYDGCCPKPVITGFNYSYEQDLLKVKYISQPGYNQCSIIGYDTNYNELINQELNCLDSSIELTGISRGQNYYFRIISQSDSCGYISSDSVFYKGADSCESKAIVKNVQYNYASKVMAVKYVARDNNINILFVYDENDNDVAFRILKNSDTTINIAGLYPCQDYRFLIGNVTYKCGVVYSDTTYYTTLDSCCSPQITTIQYNDADSSMQVNYLPEPESDMCRIKVYDENNIEIRNIEADCAGSDVIITGLYPDKKYSFRMVSYSTECDSLYSDTASYNGTCSKPVINNISYIQSGFIYGYEVFNLMQINYRPNFNYNSCTLIAYDENNNIIFNTDLECGSSYGYFTLPDHCQNYRFQIISNSLTCGDVYSDTLYYNGYETCSPTPVITHVEYNYGNAVMEVSYRPLPVSPSCVLIVHDENNNQVINQQITCNDTLVVLSTLDPDQNYYFQMVSNATNLNRKFSDVGYYGKIPKDPCIDYIPITLSEGVIIPPILSCGYQKPCITCDTLMQYVTDFRTLYPAYSDAPYLDSTASDEEAQQNSLLSRFLNYRSGFSKNATEYLLAFKECQSSGSGDVYALCGFEKPLNDASDYIYPDTTPCKGVETQALYVSQLLYESMRDSLIANFDSLYLSKCLGARYEEVFYATYEPMEYHYTLYYYDQAGNLVKTLPPAAVKPDFSTGYLEDVKVARKDGEDFPNESNNLELATQYRYNSLNQVVTQKSPDGGLSNFWYDRLGRLVVSQNKKQYPSDFSYTLYDLLGRITEVGEKVNAGLMSHVISKNEAALLAWMNSSGTNTQITHTIYDEMWGPFCGTPNILCQKNLRNRVSHTYTKATDDPGYLWDAASFYSYDALGNVDTLLQDYNTGMGAIECPGDPEHEGNRFKKIVYQYDLISGKVNAVAYQPGWTDAFYHRYDYDAENRLTLVETSKDKVYWEHDALYEYYRHGPLSRIELGENKVQGLDYAYTIQGWLKGVNSSSLQAGDFDMGNDGKLQGSHILIARDAYGFNLNYFTGDYKPISTDVAPFATVPMGLPEDPQSNIVTGKELFNGNIGSMLVNIPKLGESKVYGYRYDQLNRITRMDAFNGLNNTNNEFTPVRINDYHEAISYDPNGNIKSYKRNGTTTNLPPGVTGGIAMDDLGYEYIPNTNKLKKVSDNATYNNNYPDDINHQTDAENYEYDLIGNLTRDKAEGISIEWNVYGKISHITKDGGTHIFYTYDASGNRISKKVNNKTTYYMRDASGNVMSVYEIDATAGNPTPLRQTELHLYGSSRLGVHNVNVNVQDCQAPIQPITTFLRGNKMFELANHLGNVLVTVSDKKIGHDDGSSLVDYYNADVVTANDYYLFGSQMPGRRYSQPNTIYRYGYNGKEKDNEVKGEGNQQDYGMRIYDPRLGRFLSIDPLTKKYPAYSPYHFAGNNPILNTDLDGAEPQDFKDKWRWKNLFNAKNNASHGMSMQVDDPILGQITVEGVYDNVTEKTWFIHQDNQSNHYYFNSTNGDHQTMRYTSDSKHEIRGGKFEKFETQDQVQSRLGSGVADGMSTFFAGAISVMAAAPVIVPAAKGTVGARLTSTGVDYLSQVIGNYFSGKSDMDAIAGNINLTSLGVSFINPGSSWNKLIANNTLSSFASSTASEGYNGVGGGKSLDIAMTQAVVGAVVGRFSRGSDVRNIQLSARLTHVNALFGSQSSLSTALQSTIRNTSLVGATIGVVTGSGANAANNKMEENEK